MPRVTLTEFVSGIGSGKLLGSFPTDTVPALAARPDRAKLIFEAKQRSLDKPLILMAATITDLWPYISGSLEEQQLWQIVAEQHLPGALTLVLPASDRVSPTMNPKDPSTIGVRVPNHPVAQTVLRQTGPLATTSVNHSGQPPLQTFAEIESAFPDILTLDPSELQAVVPNSNLTIPSITASGIPSTVARWTGAGWEILRQGAVML